MHNYGEKGFEDWRKSLGCTDSQENTGELPERSRSFDETNDPFLPPKEQLHDWMDGVEFPGAFDHLSPELQATDRTDTKDTQMIIHALYTRLNSELDDCIDLLNMLEEKIQTAIQKRSGLIKGLFNYGQLSKLQKMYQGHQEVTKELIGLKSKFENQISLIATVGGIQLSAHQISTEFQTFRGTQIEKALQAFEREFPSEE